MSIGYRYAILALAGLLVAATPPPKVQDAQRKGAETQRQIAKALSGIDKSIKEANLPSELERECDPKKPNRKSDLCAQWQAADAAVKSALWTERTFYLGVAGAAIGFFTLIAAIGAAKYASDAARETKRGANEAQRAADSAVQANQSARAWICYDKFDFGAVGGEAIIDGISTTDGRYLTLGFKNVGTTPALKTWVKSYSSIVSSTDPWPVFEYKGAEESASIVAQGMTIAPGTIVLSDEQWRRLQDRIDFLYVCVFIEYRDIFQPTVARLTSISAHVLYDGFSIEPGGIVKDIIRLRTKGPQNTMT